MQIILRIDNIDRLEDGGALEYRAGERGFDIGREQHLDWTLPDPNRVISGHHCQVRFENGAYWLTDVSRNGTYINNGQSRMRSPHRLVSGDRLQIGHYFIDVHITGGAQAEAAQPMPVAAPASPAPPSGGDIWGSAAPGPAIPISRERRDQQANGRPAEPAVLNEFIAMPTGPAPMPAYSPPAYEQPPGGSPLGSPVAPGANPSGNPLPAANPFGNAPPQGMPYGQPAPQPGPGPFGQPPASNGSPFGGAMPNALPGSNALQDVPAAQFPPTEPQRMAPAGQGASGAADPFLATLAAAAGLPPGALSGRDPQELAKEIGQTLAIVSEQLGTMLRFRAAAKRMARSTPTVVERSGNNPLKFVADPAEALTLMFGPPKSGYMNGPASVTEAMRNLSAHEVATYAAMQKALARLLEDLSPDAIEDETKGSLFGNKGAKAWEVFVTRWRAKEDRSDNGMLDAFLKYFGQAYEDAHKP